MPTYKVVNADQLDRDLTNMAQALRRRCGYVDNVKMEFPSGFMNAINRIGNLIYFLVEYEEEEGVSESRQTARFVALKDMTWGQYVISTYKDEHICYDTSTSGEVWYFVDDYRYYTLRNGDGTAVSPGDIITDNAVYITYPVNTLSEG